MYPEWDPGMASGRRGLLDTPNLSAGLLGPAPIGSAQTGGMSSGWGGGSGLSGNSQLGQNKLRSRVVVVKYDRKPLSNKTLFAFTEPFGLLREHLVLKNKAFLEMSSHEAAVDVVNYYQQHPASLYGKPLTFYLSKRLMVIEKDERSSDGTMDRPVRDSQSSQVVFFSNLPREDEDKKELLTIAGRFGIVEKYLFLSHQAFVQLGTPEDAEMLVKYYSANPLSIKGRYIRFNICTKYKTLTVNRRQSGSGGEGRGQRTSTASGSSYNLGNGTSSNSRSPLSKSSSSSRSREEKSEVDGKEPNPEEQHAAEQREEEEEEEVSGVLEGEDGGEEPAGEVDAEEPEREECAEETVEGEDVLQEKDPDGEEDTDASGHVGVAEGEATQEVKAEDPEVLNLEELNTEPGETSEPAQDPSADADTAEQSFLENMEDFVTLDELAEDEDEGGSGPVDNTRKGGMRVVNINGFRRGYNFLNELLGLAKPFGKVVRHLVLDLRPEAYLQFATEEEARAMAKFYNSNVMASVCGRAVRVSHSMSYPTIQCGSSRVVYVGQIPSSKYSDEAVLKLAEPYGEIRKYFLNRIKRECFIEMEKAEDAEKMAEVCKANPPTFNGKRLTVYVSRKYRQLKHGHRFPSAPKREKSSTPTSEPPAKKFKEEKETTEGEEEQPREDEEQIFDVSSEEKREKASAEKVPEGSEQSQTSRQELQEVNQEEQVETSANQEEQPEPLTAAENKPGVATLPLPPYNPDTPIGVEHVKMGYYCRVCFLFYSNEDTAKKSHCSSKTHHEKLQKYLEKEQTKAEKKKKATA